MEAGAQRPSFGSFMPPRRTSRHTPAAGESRMHVPNYKDNTTQPEPGERE
jgi:hypothetical protein